MILEERLITCPCGREYNMARLERCPACGTRPGGTPAPKEASGPRPPAAEEPRGIPPTRVTTAPDLPGYHVTRSFGIVTSLGANSGWTASSKGNNALEQALAGLRRSATDMGANAIISLSAAAFGAHGGLTSGFGGDAVGILLIGTAVKVVHSDDGTVPKADESGDEPLSYRQEAMRQVLADDPTLGEDDPDTLARLASATDTREAELRLRAERDAVLALLQAPAATATASPAAPSVFATSPEPAPAPSVLMNEPQWYEPPNLSKGAPVQPEPEPERVVMLTEADKQRLMLVRPPDPGAGWYPDPLQQRAARFWNGDQWTGRVRG